MKLKVALIPLVLLTLQSHLTSGSEKYSIKQLNSNEVIYLETLDKIKLYHEQWKIVIGYDLFDLESNYHILKNTYKELLHHCYYKFDNKTWKCSSERRITKRIEQFSELANDLE